MATKSKKTDLKQSMRNQTHFSTTLAAHLLSEKHDTNVVFSPLSIHVVLSFTAAGCGGRTLDQVLTFLKANSNNELNDLYTHRLSTIFADVGSPGSPRLLFVNGVWIDKTLTFKPAFKHAVETVYKADCKVVDFGEQVEDVVKEVNMWAQKQTNGLIKEILPVDVDRELVRLFFTNAVYFKGTWKETYFDASNTIESDFHLLRRSKVKVPFMTSRLRYHLVSVYDGFKVLGLRYSKGKEESQFTMYVFLPDENNGLQSLVKKIASTSDFLDEHIPRTQVLVGRLMLPKFKIEFGFLVSEMLQNLGIVLPFSRDSSMADHGVSEMADSSIDERICVSSIHHKSFIEVNEKGTEAAAVTAESDEDMGFSLYDVPCTVDFVADHPFLFVLREDVTKAVLFMGQVTDPSVG